MNEALLRDSYGQGPTLPGGPLLHSAIETAQRFLVSRQSEEGFWKSELNGDATLEAPTGPLRGINHARFTAVLTHRDGRWVAAAFHNTLVAAPPS